MQDHPSSTSRFAVFAWATLGYLILVVLWGAYVRATGSGAGCGEHWPLCNGQFLPRSPRLETIIEFSHRLSSGLSLVLVGGLVFWSFKRFGKGHATRHGAVLSTVFLLLEAAVGAGLVLLDLVAHNTSASRAVAIAIHLVNTFILLGCLTYTASFASLGIAERFKRHAGRLRTGVVLGGILLFLVVGAAGAIVALGDTLFPAKSLAEGMQQDWSPTAHFLIRLRVLHPILAVTTAVYLVVMGGFLRNRDPRPIIFRLTRGLTLIICLQVALGVLNMMLLAPIWLQMVHLLAADLTWILLVAIGVVTLREPETELLSKTVSKQPLPEQVGA